MYYEWPREKRSGRKDGGLIQHCLPPQPREVLWPVLSVLPSMHCSLRLASINIKECVFPDKPAHITTYKCNHPIITSVEMPHHHSIDLHLPSLSPCYPSIVITHTSAFPLSTSVAVKLSCFVNPFKSFPLSLSFFKFIIYSSRSNSTNSDSVQ